MKTIKDILELSTSHLESKGILSPRRSAEEILSHFLKLKRLDLYMHFDKPLGEDELDSCRQALRRRAQGEPLAYILASTVFFDCQFELSPDVLIPRPETEILVDKIAEELAAKSRDELKEMTLWDVCCGSGCIGISLKKRFPDLNVMLSDISSAALDLARRNATKNDVDVEFREGDLLEPFLGEKADVFVCNPPYISLEEYASLSREVREFEPKLALLAGESGFELYERLSKDLPSFLRPGAKVYFELGYQQGKKLEELFHSSEWASMELGLDWAGHDRFFFLEKE